MFHIKVNKMGEQKILNANPIDLLLFFASLYTSKETY